MYFARLSFIFFLLNNLIAFSLQADYYVKTDISTDDTSDKLLVSISPSEHYGLANSYYPSYTNYLVDLTTSTEIKLTTASSRGLGVDNEGRAYFTTTNYVAVSDPCSFAGHLDQLPASTLSRVSSNGQTETLFTTAKGVAIRSVSIGTSGLLIFTSKLGLEATHASCSIGLGNVDEILFSSFTGSPQVLPLNLPSEVNSFSSATLPDGSIVFLLTDSVLSTNSTFAKWYRVDQAGSLSFPEWSAVPNASILDHDGFNILIKKFSGPYDLAIDYYIIDASTGTERQLPFKLDPRDELVGMRNGFFLGKTDPFSPPFSPTYVSETTTFLIATSGQRQTINCLINADTKIGGVGQLLSDGRILVSDKLGGNQFFLKSVPGTSENSCVDVSVNFVDCPVRINLRGDGNYTVRGKIAASNNCSIKIKASTQTGSPVKGLRVVERLLRGNQQSLTNKSGQVKKNVDASRFCRGLQYDIGVGSTLYRPQEISIQKYSGCN